MNDSQKIRKQLSEKRERRELATAAIPKYQTPEVTKYPDVSDSTYHQIFLTSPDLSVIIDPANSTYIEVNDAFVKHTGFTREEIIGHNVLETDLLVDREEFQRVVQVFDEQGQVTNEELNLRTKSGEIQQWTCSAKIININGSDRLIAVATDTTKRKRTEEELRFTEAAFKSIHEGVIITDQDLNILYFNEISEELFGIKASEAIGKQLKDVTKPIMRYPGQDKSLDYHLLNRGYNRDEMIFDTANGNAWFDVTIRKIEIEGEIHGSVLTFQDITEHKKADEAMRESEVKYRSVVENADIGIVVIQDNHLVFNNPWIQKTFGYTKGDFAKLNFISMIHPDDREMIVERVKEKLAGSPVDDSREIRVLTKSGDIRWIDAKSVKIQWNGKPAIQAFIRDVTEHKLEEEKHRAILETALDGFKMISLKGEILEVNNSYCKMLGYTREELLGMKVEDIEALLPPEKLDNHAAAILRNGSERFETKQRCKDGRIIDVDISANYLDIGEGQISIFVRDITERKQAEGKLREKEYLLNEVCNIANIGGWEMDLITRKATWTKGLYDIMEMDYEDSIPGPDEHIEYYLPEFHSLVTDAMNQLIEDDQPMSYEAMYRTEKGNIRWCQVLGKGIRVNGKCIKVYGTSQDITERKHAEETLKESEERFRTLYETMLQGVMSQDAAGKIISINPAAERILGLTTEQIQGRTSADLHRRAIHEDGSDFPDEQHPSMVALRTGQPVSGVIMGVYHPVKNEYRWIIINAVPEFKEGMDAPFRVYTTFNDITERKRAEEQLRESEELRNAVFNATPNLAAVIDEEWNIIDINEAMANRFGKHREELIGSNGKSILPHRLAESRNRYFKEVFLTGKPCRFEDERLGMYFDNIVYPIFREQGKIKRIAIHATDITERKLAEEKLRTILSTSLDGFIIHDAKSKILEVNNAYCNMIGYTREELLGMMINDIDVLLSTNNTAGIPQKGSAHFETKHRHKDGRIIDVDVSTNYLDIGEGQLAVFIRDITKRKRMEEELRFTEAAFKSIRESVIMMDKNSIITYWNDISEKIFGVKAEEAIGKDIRKVIHPVELHPGYERELGEKMEEKGYSRDEILYKTKRGKIWVDMSIQVIKKDHKKQGYVLTGVDITKRKQEEEKHRAILSTSLDGFSMDDLKGNILEVNDAYCNMTGYTREELLGMTIKDVEAQQYTEEINKSLAEITERGSARFETKHRCKDGHIIDVEISVNYLDIGEGLISVFIRDITEHKRAELALRESEERFSKAFHVTSNLMGISRIKDGYILDINEAYSNLLGYGREELIGRTSFEMDIWADLEQRKIVVKKLQEEGKVRDLEVEIRTKTGDIRTILFSADTMNLNGEQCLINMATDITERKRAEEALKASEAQLQGILRAAPLGIILARNHIALWVNNYFTIMTGYSPEEVIGTNGRIFASSDEEFEEIIRVLDEGVERGGVGEMEAQLLCKNGKTIDVLLISTLLNPDNLAAGRITTFLDITERKKAEEQVTEANNLRELDRLRTELLANVSHELRTPLASIKGFTTVLLDYDSKLEPGEKDEYLEIINHNTDRLSELIEQLLVMSRLDAGMLTIEKEPSDIDTLCRETVAEARIRSPEYNFTLDIPAGLPQANIDPRRIRQVLDNLINNAVKFSDTETEITIIARKNSPREILMTVADNGPGISLKDQPYLFDRRFHTEHKHKLGTAGAGLGLSICKGLVEAHRGRIWIESREGEGTKCFFTVPIHKKRDGSSHGKKDKR